MKVNRLLIKKRIGFRAKTATQLDLKRGKLTGITTTLPPTTGIAETISVVKFG